jgi:hypothetical protein
MHPLKKLLTVLLAVLIATIAGTVFAYQTIPTHDTNLTHFDTIIVLGTPANPDGTPSPEQRERTLEGVRQFKAGVAPHLILTGGPAHNQFVEAHVMATLAIAQGVPPAAVIEEPQARTALILEHYPLAWRTDPAPWPSEYTFWQRAARYCVEAQYCLKLRLFGFPMTPFLPHPA